MNFPLTKSIISLLLVLVCVLSVLAAPQTRGDSSSSEENNQNGHSHSAAPSDMVPVPGDTGSPDPAVPMDPNGNMGSVSSGLPPHPATLVRVRRNKHPIRYNKKSISNGRF